MFLRPKISIYIKNIINVLPPYGGKAIIIICLPVALNNKAALKNSSMSNLEFMFLQIVSPAVYDSGIATCEADQ